VNQDRVDTDQLEWLAIRSFLEQGAKCGFESLFEAFYPRVVRFFRTRGLDRETCEDLAQNVFLSVFRSARHVRDPLRFRAWLFRIVRNEWLQHRRRSAASMRSGRPESMADLENLSATGFSPHLAAEIDALLRPLTEDEREIVRLHFFDGLLYREIAELLDMAVGTVKWKIFQIKLKLVESKTEMAGA
jgi:RNA polymerase sigma-70 factor (ECF subfamily)